MALPIDHMDRYDTRIEDDTLYIEAEGDDLEVGSMADVCEILGGDSYTIEYEEDAVKAARWLRTDPDGTLSFDVRETIDDMDYDASFVKKIAAEPLDRETAEGYPARTAEFAELMAEIWDSKGNVEIE